MDFCKSCHNMLFITRKDTTLLYKCKVCGKIEPYTRDSKCIYRTDYTKKHLSIKGSTNKYLRYDPTLPRIQDKPCSNEECITSQKKDYFTDKIILKDIPYLHKSEVLEAIKTTLLELPDLEDGNEYQITQVYMDDIMITHHDFDKKLLISKLNKNQIIKKYNIKIISAKIIKPEIIFIKYNQDDMKYLYYCCYCTTIWKNI